MNAPEFPCDLVDWQRFHDQARDLAHRIRKAGFRPDVIVAVARGGYVPARVLCDFLGVMELTSFRVEHYRGIRQQSAARIRDPLCMDLGGKRILLVDDVSDTGDTFEVGLQHLREMGPPAEIRTCTLQHKTVSRFEPDFYSEVITQWRWVSFPWAHIEDLAALIRQLPSRPESTATLVEVLERRHGFSVSPSAVNDALAFLRFQDG